MKESHDFKIVKSSVSKDVSISKTISVPVEPTTNFLTTDKKVVNHLQLKNVSGKHRLRWEWYMPNGRLYYSSKEVTVNPSSGKYVKNTSHWHRMFIKGERASNYPGNWMVKAYYDDEVISSKKFNINEKKEKKPGGLFISTVPENAKIRILNIKPKYSEGMKLKNGKYNVEVSAEGYRKKRMWINFTSGMDNNINIQLEKEEPQTVSFLSKRNAYAIIIGISQYKNSGSNGFPELAFADDDAESFRDMLLRLGWSSSHIKLLVNENAERNDILIALESWLTKVGPDDMIVLFWSGHGFPDPEDPEKVYFACYDTKINIPATGYRMDRVRSILRERNAKNVVVFADTCHAGKLITRSARGIKLTTYVQKMKREKRVPRGWIFMVGADTDRQAIEHSSWSNGAFTHTLLKALGGEADGYESVSPKDGTVSMRELRSYMESVMPDETQRVLGVAKRPIVTTSSGDPNIWNITLNRK